MCEPHLSSPELKWSSVADKSYLVQRTPALGQAFETVSGADPGYAAAEHVR